MDAMELAEDAGFTAYGAANADVAMCILESNPGICVLFTDVDMPGSMNGLKLARTVRDRWPLVWIIVASGHVRVTKEDLPEDGIFFPKPYPPRGVTAALKQIAGAVLH